MECTALNGVSDLYVAVVVCDYSTLHCGANPQGTDFHDKGNALELGVWSVELVLINTIWLGWCLKYPCDAGNAGSTVRSGKQVCVWGVGVGDVVPQSVRGWQRRILIKGGYEAETHLIPRRSVTVYNSLCSTVAL